MPEVDYDLDSIHLWMFKLAKSGYGDIQTIKNLDGETFMNLIHYENYLLDYEKAVRALNTKR